MADEERDRRAPDFSNPIVEIDVWHLDGTVTLETYDPAAPLGFHWLEDGAGK
jgi:hypothetical protein